MTLTKKAKVEYLRKVALFSSLSDRALGAIAAKAEVIEYGPGQYIVRQKQIGTGFYLIIRGRARVVRGSDELAVLGPGAFFGELSVLDQSPRMAHVVAIEPTVCLALASWDFIQLLERNPKIAVAMLGEMARRLRSAGETHHH
jgi:CRP/FNR family cyclic AMP-dependent transcriptional regulator